MRRWPVLLLFGLLAYGLFLLLQLPAALLFTQLQRAAPALRASGLSGTLYQGQAASVRWRGEPLGRLSWRLVPASLLHGRLGFAVVVSRGTELALQTTASVGLQRQLRLRALAGHMPLATLLSLAQRPPTPLQGRFTLALQQLLLTSGGRPLSASGTVQLHEVRLTALPGQTLGPFQARLHSTGRRIIAELRDQGGPLRLAATLTLDPDGRYRLAGELAARAHSPPAVAGLITALGGTGNGRLRLDLGGRWF